MCIFFLSVLLCVWACLSLAVCVWVSLSMSVHLCVCACLSVYVNLDLLEHFINFGYVPSYSSLFSAGPPGFLKLLEKDGTMGLFFVWGCFSPCVNLSPVSAWRVDSWILVRLCQTHSWVGPHALTLTCSSQAELCFHHVWDLGLWSENVSSEGWSGGGWQTCLHITDKCLGYGESFVRAGHP